MEGLDLAQYKFYLHNSNNISVFKNVFDGLKDIFCDSNPVKFNLNDEGIRINQTKQDTQITVNMLIASEKMEYYYCQEPFKIGVNVPIFSKIMKSIDNDSRFKMYIRNGDEHILSIDVAESNGQTINININLKDCHDEFDSDDHMNMYSSFQPTDYSVELNMSYQQLKKDCDRMKSFKMNNFQISYSNGHFSISGRNDLDEVYKTINIPSNDFDSSSKMPELILDQTYSMETIGNFIKCAGAGGSGSNYQVILNMDIDKPMLCNIPLSIGELDIYLTQTNTENDDF